jgi:hypothetical protein
MSVPPVLVESSDDVADVTSASSDPDVGSSAMELEVELAEAPPEDPPVVLVAPLTAGLEQPLIAARTQAPRASMHQRLMASGVRANSTRSHRRTVARSSHTSTTSVAPLPGYR